MDRGYGRDDILKKEVFEVIKEAYDVIFSAERKVADYVLQNPMWTVDSNVSELAKASGVSDATVVRLCHHIGYSGYYQFRLALSRDMGRNQFRSAGEMESEDAVEKIFNVYADTLREIGRTITTEQMKACSELLINANIVHIMAVGNTAPLAQHMGFRLGRIGVRSTYNVAPEYFMNQVNLAMEGDVVVAISQSGSANEVIQGVKLAAKRGLKCIAITASANSPVAKLADYVLLTRSKEDSFDYHKGYMHLYETAVIDALIDFAANEERITNTDADQPEMILSGTKI